MLVTGEQGEYNIIGFEYAPGKYGIAIEKDSRVMGVRLTEDMLERAEQVWVEHAFAKGTVFFSMNENAVSIKWEHEGIIEIYEMEKGPAITCPPEREFIYR